MVGKPVVYLIAGPPDLFKIGWTSGAPEERLKALRTGTPYPLSLLDSTVGGPRYEAELHRRYADVRVHGEWFALTANHLAELKEEFDSRVPRTPPFSVVVEAELIVDVLMGTCPQARESLITETPAPLHELGCPACDLGRFFWERVAPIYESKAEEMAKRLCA